MDAVKVKDRVVDREIVPVIRSDDMVEIGVLDEWHAVTSYCQ